MKRFFYIQKHLTTPIFLIHLSLVLSVVYPFSIPMLKILQNLHVISQLPKIENIYTLLAAAIAYTTAILIVPKSAKIYRIPSLTALFLGFIYIISLVRADVKILSWCFRRYLIYTTGLCLLLSVPASNIRDHSQVTLWVSFLLSLLLLAFLSFGLHFRAVLLNKLSLLYPLNSLFHPNIMGSLMGIGLLTSVGLINGLKKSQRYIGILCKVAIFVFTIAFLLTQSRAAWISFLISLPFLYTERKKRLISFAFTASLLIFFLTTIFLLPENLKSYIKFADKFALSMEYRTRIWKAALAVFSKHIFLGVGIGGFTLVPERLYNLPYKVSSVHNQYIEFLLETGIIGFTTFFFLIIATIAKLKNIIKQKNCSSPSIRLIPVAIFIFLLINFFFESRLKTTQFNVIFYTTIGIIWNGAQQRDRN